MIVEKYLIVLIDIVTTQSVLPEQGKRKSQTAINPLTRDARCHRRRSSHEAGGVRQARSKREGFEKRRKIDGRTEHQIL